MIVHIEASLPLFSYIIQNTFHLSMFQVTFSEQSMDELAKLDTLKQMDLVNDITNLSLEEIKGNRNKVGSFHRGKETFYRFRSGEFRCYFSLKESILLVQYILHKNTFTDFVFRSKLPVTDEVVLEQDTSFWQYLESLSKSK